MTEDGEASFTFCAEWIVEGVTRPKVAVTKLSPTPLSAASPRVSSGNIRRQPQATIILHRDLGAATVMPEGGSRDQIAVLLGIGDGDINFLMPWRIGSIPRLCVAIVSCPLASLRVAESVST